MLLSPWNPLYILSLLLSSSAGVFVSTSDIDGNGIPDLVIIASGAQERVRITQSEVDGLRLFVDANFDGDFDDAGDVNDQALGAIDQILVFLGGGDDLFELKTVNTGFVGETVSVFADLGPGSDEFNLSTLGDTISSSNFLCEILGRGGDDECTLDFSTFSTSSVGIVFDGGPGNDTFTSTHHDSVATSEVVIRANLGSGTNSARVLLDSVTTLGDVSGGPVNVKYTVLGGSGVDNVVFSCGDSRILSGAAFEFAAALGNGNDTGTAEIDLGKFRALNSSNSPRGGDLRIAMDGGFGNDTLRATRVVNGVLTTGPAILDGSLEIVFAGDFGNDHLVADLGGPGAWTSTDADALNRRLRFSALGGPGFDNLQLDFSNAALFTGAYEIQAFGGLNDDTMAFSLVNLGGATFGWNHGVILDGGAGVKDTVTTSGNATIRKRNFELP